MSLSLYSLARNEGMNKAFVYKDQMGAYCNLLPQRIAWRLYVSTSQIFGQG